MGGWVADLVERMLDGIEGRETVDLMSSFALPLPLAVISEMLGIPEAERMEFHNQVVRLIEVNDKPVRRAIRWLPAMPKLMKFFEDLIDLRRREPDGRLIAKLIQVEDNGDVLSRDELIAMIFLLLFAGHETSVNLIGNGLLALLDHPDQMELLRQRPELMGDAVDELLRYTNPVESGTMRFALEDVTIAGVTIPQGRHGDGNALVRQPRRERLHQCRQVRHHAPRQASSGAGVRPALLPRRLAGPDGGPRRAERTAATLPRRRACGGPRRPRLARRERPEGPEVAAASPGVTARADGRRGVSDGRLSADPRRIYRQRSAALSSASLGATQSAAPPSRRRFAFPERRAGLEIVHQELGPRRTPPPGGADAVATKTMVSPGRMGPNRWMARQAWSGQRRSRLLGHPQDFGFGHPRIMLDLERLEPTALVPGTGP